MNYFCENINWISVLNDEKICNKDAIKFFEFVISREGYISGGFARVLANQLLNQNRLDPYVVMQYIGFKTKFDFNNPFWKSGSSDVDIFFNNKENAITTTNLVINQLTPTYWKNTIAHFGYDVLYGNVIFQLITKINGSPKDVLNTFDISNAKVYLDEKGIHYSSEWKELEERRLLGINISDKPNLLWRVRKWFSKHNYVDLRPGDHEKFVNVLYEVADKINDKSLIRYNKPVTITELRSIIKKFIYISPPDQIIKASLLLDSYSQMTALNNLSHNYKFKNYEI
jgi:hypothetical protein